MACAGAAYIALDLSGFQKGYSSNVGFAVVDSGSLKYVVSIVLAVVGPIILKYYPALAPLLEKVKVDGLDVLTPNGLLSALSRLRSAYTTNKRLQDAITVVLEESVKEMFKPDSEVKTIYVDATTGKQVAPPVNVGG